MAHTGGSVSQELTLFSHEILKKVPFSVFALLFVNIVNAGHTAESKLSGHS